MNMKNLNPALTRIDAQIAQLTTSLQQQSAQSTRPQWVQGDKNTQQRMVNKAVGKIIANELAQDPKLSATNLPATEQKAVFRALAQYTQLKTAQVLQALKPVASTANSNDEANKKDLLNKKITAAKKLLAAIMFMISESHAQYYKKKLHKVLRRLASLEKRKDQAEMLATLATQEQKPESDPLLLPTLTPTPTPQPKQTPDHKLHEGLQILGLGLGADHKAIEAAFAKFSQEFAAKPNHTAEEQAQFDLIQKAYNTLMAVSAERLTELPKITGKEIEEFASAFKALMPDMLGEGRALSLESLKAVFIEGGIQKSAENESAAAPGQMQRMQLTMAKLEKQFGADPKQLINLKQEFLTPQAQSQSQSPSRLMQTPTLRPPTGS